MRLFFAALLTITFGQILPRTLFSSSLYAVVTLPGTFLHESTHYLMALWLQGHPEGFTLIPTWGANGMETMGHIMFEPTVLNAASVSLAPYMLVFPACYLITIAATCRIQWMVLWCYIAACGFASLTPSSQDWNVAMSQPWSFALAVPLFFIFAVLWIAGIRNNIK